MKRHLLFWLFIAMTLALFDHIVAPHGYGPRIHHQQMHKYGGAK